MMKIFTEIKRVKLYRAYRCTSETNANRNKTMDTIELYIKTIHLLKYPYIFFYFSNKNKNRKVVVLMCALKELSRCWQHADCQVEPSHFLTCTYFRSKCTFAGRNWEKLEFLNKINDDTVVGFHSSLIDIQMKCNIVDEICEQIKFQIDVIGHSRCALVN